MDTRAVLYGPALLAHLASGVRNALDALDEEQQQERTRRIHAEWLLSARGDLGSRTPREVLLADRERIASDLEHRAEQWSQQKHPVPALARDSTAYRLGGFGTTEVVLYFDLVRDLLALAWKLTMMGPHSTETLIEQLAAFRDYWLEQPHEGGMKTAELIELERRRMPVAGDASHLDCDCPICQAMARDEFGPMFMWFDGHHLELEDEFAFSLCRTREKWDRQQEDFRQRSEAMDRKQREREAAGPDSDDPLTGSAWQSSYVDWDLFTRPGATRQDALLALGFPLGELTCDLRERPDGSDIMRRLNKAYGDLQASEDGSVTVSAAQQFRELLEVVSANFGDLTTKCADLESRLDEVLRRFS